MTGRGGLPLSALLSQVLVAFTIEFDNEFERRTTHRTTEHGSTGGVLQGPWLASLAMWSNCMQFVGEEGVSVRELEVLARTTTNLNGMQRWGYISVAPDPADNRPKPPRSAWLIRPTRKALQAREVWRPLFAEIETRWQARFGTEQIRQLCELLGVLMRQVDVDLPDCLPILGYGLLSKGPDRPRRVPAAHEKHIDPHLPLSALLSKVLLLFAMEFERESELSLAISANVVRVLDEKGFACETFRC